MNFKALTTIALALALPAASASADITSITLTSSTSIGSFKGKPYREAELQVNGSAPGGAYSVPVTIAFPTRARDSNGVAVVDFANTALVNIGFWLGDPVLPLARIHGGDEFLFGSGLTYLSVVWDKNALEFLKLGAVAAYDDVWEIMRDIGHLARTPYLLPPPARPRVAPSATFAYGYSQSASLLREFFRLGLNDADGPKVFDGALPAASEGLCLPPSNVYTVCPGTVSGVKYISLSTEKDAELSAFVERGQTETYRSYEIAGVTHIPGAVLDLGDAYPNQNPVDISQPIRGMMANMIDWITKGTSPPDSVALVDDTGVPGELFGLPYMAARRDADGNALGGIRLPHMPSTVHGRPAGAPLGHYHGMNFEADNPIGFLSGTFFPFSHEELVARYGNHGTYVVRVIRAVRDLVRKRYIIKADAHAYIRAAVVHAPVP